MKHLLALAAGLTLAGCVRTPDWQVEAAAQGRWAVGDFELQLSADSWRLSQGSGQTLWASQRAPLGASQVELQADEQRGMVKLDEQERLRCAGLRVLTAQAQPDRSLRLQAELRCGGQPQSLSLWLRPHVAEVGQAVAIDAELGPGPVNRLHFNADSPTDEALWGGGMQASRINWKGAELPVVASEQGVGRGRQPLTWLADLTNNGAGGKAYSSYAAIPHWLSNRGRSFWVDSHALVRLDAQDGEHLSLSVQAPSARLVLRQAASPLALIQAHTAEIGRMRALPDWIMDGAIVGLQGGSDAVDAKLATLRAAGVPIAALWLQDWVGQRSTSFGKQLWWNWQLDASHYPRFAQQVAGWRAQGVRWLGYANPFLVELPSADPRRRLLDEAHSRGFLLKDATGQPLMSLNTSFSAAHVDLDKPAAYAWLKAVLRDQLLAQGASGWMADFAEGRPFSGPDAMAAHNRWPELWARLNRELADENPELVVFHRSAWSRSPAHAGLFWLGDQLVDWDAHDGLASAVTGLLSAGLSGMSLNHSDIGGYTTLSRWPMRIERTPELLMRWAEMAAFTPVMRTHEGNRPDANAQVYSSPALAQHFARMVRLHGCWREERRRLVTQASTQGWPLNRAMALAWPTLPGVWTEAQTQFLAGADVLVAPVVKPGAGTVSVRIPEPGWQHLWSGRAAEPGRQDWPAPLGEPAVFVRSGSPAATELLPCAAALRSGASGQKAVDR